MQPLRTLSSHAVLLSRDDVDTDQIIPARFLTTTSRLGLGRHLFTDWRYNANGALRAEFELNAPNAAGAQVLVTGRNFGCGSSREHAPWALADWGVRVIIANSFADIFRNNAHKNGLLTIELDDTTLAELHALLRAQPLLPVTVDLASQVVTVGADLRASFAIDSFAKRCLLDGLDELGLLLSVIDDIERYEAACAR